MASPCLWTAVLFSFAALIHLPTVSLAAPAPLTMVATFSTDGGQTWTEQPPTVPESAKLQVRVAWTFADQQDAAAGFRVAKVVCTTGDFASATNGYHGSWSPKGWYEKSPLQYAGTQSVILDVDLGGRPAGVLGEENLWTGGKFEAGLLPETKPLPPGPHAWQAQLRYVDQARNRRLTVTRDFTLSIADAEGHVPAIVPEAQPVTRAPKPARRPTSPVPAPALTQPGPVLYVDVNHAKASDDNDGLSPQRPLKTLRRTLELVEHGGTIRLAAGIYREGDLLLRKSGTAEFPLTIAGAGMDKTWVKGSTQLTEWHPASGIAGAYVAPAPVANVQQMWVDGEALQQIGVRSAWNTKILWDNQVCLPPTGAGLADLRPGSFFHDPASGRLFVVLPNRADPREHVVEAGRFADGLLGAGTSHVVLRDLSIVQNNGTGNAFKSRLLELGEHHWLVENCRIADGEFMGIGWTGQHHTLRHCEILRNGDTGIDMANTNAAHGWRWHEDAPEMDALIDDCLFEGNNARGFFAAWHAGAMKCIPACRQVTIRGNTFRNNHAAAVWFDHAHGQIVIRDNLFEHNRKAIFYEISSAGPGDSFGAFIANNRIFGSEQQGLYLSAACDSQVLNNTFHDNWVHLVLHGMPRKEWTLENNLVRDNLFGAASRAQVIVFTGKDAAHNAFDSNAYLADGDGALAVGLVSDSGYEVTTRSLAELQASGFEKQGVVVGNESVEAGTQRLLPLAESAAHGKGWLAAGCPHSPPPSLAKPAAADSRASGERPLLANGEFDDKSPAGGATGWPPESHGLWKTEDGVTYLHLLPGKHINQQVTLDPAWRQLKVTARLRIPEVHPGETERDAAGFRLRFVDADDKLIQPPPHWMFRDGVPDWRESSTVLTVPPNARRLKVTVAIYCPGQMDLDYVRIEPRAPGQQ